MVKIFILHTGESWNFDGSNKTYICKCLAFKVERFVLYKVNSNILMKLGSFHSELGYERVEFAQK